MQIQNAKLKGPKSQWQTGPRHSSRFRHFFFASFEFVSHFGFRASDFDLRTPHSVSSAVG